MFVKLNQNLFRLKIVNIFKMRSILFSKKMVYHD